MCSPTPIYSLHNKKLQKIKDDIFLCQYIFICKVFMDSVFLFVGLYYQYYSFQYHLLECCFYGFRGRCPAVGRPELVLFDRSSEQLVVRLSWNLNSLYSHLPPKPSWSPSYPFCATKLSFWLCWQWRGAKRGLSIWRW